MTSTQGQGSSASFVSLIQCTIYTSCRFSSMKLTTCGFLGCRFCTACHLNALRFTMPFEQWEKLSEITKKKHNLLTNKNHAISLYKTDFLFFCYFTDKPFRQYTHRFFLLLKPFWFVLPLQIYRSV